MQFEKSRRIFVIFIFLLLGFVVFLSIVYFKIALPRKMPTLIINKTDVAVRGSIYTKDEYSLARSKKLYKLGFNPRSIDPNKKDLFVTLLEIYSDISREKILEALSQPRYKILSYSISPNVAASLKTLNAKLLELVKTKMAQPAIELLSAAQIDVNSLIAGMAEAAIKKMKDNEAVPILGEIVAAEGQN